MIEKCASVSRRYYVGIASVLLTGAAMALPSHAGGWEEFLKRCISPMEAGDVPSIGGLDLVDKDPIGQAFDLPGNAHLAVRPPFQDFGLQCLVVTQPVQVAKDAFDVWIMSAVTDGTYTLDTEIDSRWVTGPDITARIEKPMAMDVWQEGDWLVFQMSFLETQP